MDTINPVLCNKSSPADEEFRVLRFYGVLLLMPLIFIFLMHQLVRNKILSKSKPLPPGPKPWPLIGNLPEMLMNRPTFRWILGLMDKMNTEIACFRFGNVHVIAVTSPEIACEFLKKQDAVFSSRPTSTAAYHASSGYITTILVPLGEQWKKMRKVMATEVLSQARHVWLHQKRAEEADHLVYHVHNQCATGEGIVNIRKVSQHYCANVARKMIFSKRFFGKEMEDGGPGVEDQEHVEAIFTTLATLYVFSLSDYVPFLRGRVDFDGHEKTIKKAVASAKKYQDPEIDERIRLWENGTMKGKEDLLDVLINLKTTDGKPLLSTAEIKAQIQEIMIAAMDNPSNGIEWALAEMINKPHMLETAIEELDRVVGKDRLVQESDINDLNYIKACAKEAFRLHPMAPFNVPHVSVSNTMINGFFIPKGSHVLVSRIGLGRNPRIWDQPLKFKPERHMKENGSRVVLFDPYLHMLSFSVGRRGCPGVTLGTTMTVMLLARLLQGFTWGVPSTMSTIDLTESITDISLAKPLLALAKPRLAKKLYSKS